MLDDFFKLNQTYQEIDSNQKFEELLHHGKDIRNYLYRPNELQSDTRSKLKIQDTTFNNFSFSKTEIKNIVFLNCTFEDCLFIGSNIIQCEFHNCRFKNTNLYKIEISNTYIDPNSFDFSILNKDISKANIAVHLFKKLQNNSRDMEQSDFARSAYYQFRKWNTRLIKYKYKKSIPYPVSHFAFWTKYPFEILYKWTSGYGIRLRNFLITFMSIFLLSFSFNYFNWNKFKLKEKDVLVDSFNPDSVNIATNFSYTLDVTTKLIDSQMQPTSIFGMECMAAQSLIAFIMLTALVTIILNKFVK